MVLVDPDSSKRFCWGLPARYPLCGLALHGVQAEIPLSSSEGSILTDDNPGTSMGQDRSPLHITGSDRYISGCKAGLLTPEDKLPACRRQVRWQLVFPNRAAGVFVLRVTSKDACLTWFFGLPLCGRIGSPVSSLPVPLDPFFRRFNFCH